MELSAISALLGSVSAAAKESQSFAEWLGIFFDSIPGRLVHVALIIIFAFLTAWLLRVIIRHVVRRIVNGVKKSKNITDTQTLLTSPLAAVRVVQRTRTLGTVLSNIVNIVVVIIALMLIIATIDIKILASFGLLGAAIGAGLGFGAQRIVNDVLNGMFMVMEDQLGVGDVVDLGPATGVVEAVGIRISQIRDVNGTLWFVRNGEITRVGNMSQGWARVIIDLAVPYETDVNTVQERMLETAQNIASNPKWRSRILEKPELWGIESVSEDAIVLRIVMKTRSLAKDDVARELRFRLKEKLDEMDIILPSLSSVVLSGFDGATSIAGARPPRTKPMGIVTETPAQKKTRLRASRAKTSGSNTTSPKEPKF